MMKVIQRFGKHCSCHLRMNNYCSPFSLLGKCVTRLYAWEVRNFFYFRTLNFGSLFLLSVSLIVFYCLM
jgi:hypothetical protein